MKILTNFSSAQIKEWFKGDNQRLISFMKRNHLDGMELILYGSAPSDKIPRDLVHGVHLSYWPTWLDLWRENEGALLEQFKTLDNIELYYGGLTRDALISHYRLEFEKARALGAKYVVFHVSHVQMAHIYTWDFDYSDLEVLQATAELVNEAFGQEDTGVTILFENLWWPGLTFLNYKLTEAFIASINYPRKGFMLDTGHLMVTNRGLKDEETAYAYMSDTLEDLGALKKYIKGIHLNKSLPGQYLKQDHSLKKKKMQEMDNVWDQFMEARRHVTNIDRHLPVESADIGQIIKQIQPEYVVHEFITENVEELESLIATQNKAIHRFY